MLLPEATANPLPAPVVELSHEYVYDPLPPVGVAPFNVCGVVPEQIVCTLLMVLPAITGCTVTAMAADVSEHAPETR